MPDGTLDTSFGGNGKTTIGFGNDDGAYAMVLQPDGKIIVGGYREETSDCPGCLGPPFPAGFSYCKGGMNMGDLDFALARLNPNGSLDPTFDVDGKVATGLGHKECLYGLALQPDGKIVTPA